MLVKWLFCANTLCFSHQEKNTFIPPPPPSPQSMQNKLEWKQHHLLISHSEEARLTSLLKVREVQTQKTLSSYAAKNASWKQ